MYQAIYLSLLIAFAISISAMEAPKNYAQNQQTKQLADAIINNDKAQFDALLASGANHLIPYQYDAKDHSKARLPAIIAILYYRYDMCRILLSKSPEAQINGNEGATLMQYAAMKGAHELYRSYYRMAQKLIGRY